LSVILQTYVSMTRLRNLIQTAMSLSPILTIDRNEQFPALLHPPGIEAVIYWHASSIKNLAPTNLKSELVRRFPDYSIQEPPQNSEIDIVSSSNDAPEMSDSDQWGFRLQDNQGHLVQFTSTGCVFSRLYNYEKGNDFQAEAMRFWDVFLELAAPKSIYKLGIRYVSLIRLKSTEKFSTYLITMPISPPISGLVLPVDSFFYQDRYQIPGHSYQVDFVRTSRPQKPSQSSGQELIIDINVFTKEISLERESLAKQLHEMRWVKSKIFFGCMTKTALENFGA
jgi:uncharacterized protein (TIGR04255 family)